MEGYIKYFGFMVICGIVLASCSSGEDVDAGVASFGLIEPTTLDSNVSITEEQMATRYVSCLRGRGFILADPTMNYDGTIDWAAIKTNMDGNTVYNNKNKRNTSLEECSIYLEDGSISKQDDREDVVKLQDDLLLLAECMRSNGIYISDPDFSGDDKADWKGGFDVSKHSNATKAKSIMDECTDLVFRGYDEVKGAVK